MTSRFDDMTLDELSAHGDAEAYVCWRDRSIARDAILDLQGALDAEGLVVMSGPMIERLLADAYDCGILYARGFNRDADHG
jgi:hypothetical protein